jgi:RES domain-containing protein
MQIWRLARRAFCPTAAAAFDGAGAELTGQRWNAKGTRAVYAAESRSLAVLEILVHIDRHVAPSDYIFLSATIPDAAIEPLPNLPAGWRTSDPNAITVGFGQAFLTATAALAIRLPSVVIPSECNLLINPNHADFATIAIAPAMTSFEFDRRLFV